MKGDVAQVQASPDNYRKIKCRFTGMRIVLCENIIRNHSGTVKKNEKNIVLGKSRIDDQKKKKKFENNINNGIILSQNDKIKSKANRF